MKKLLIIFQLILLIHSPNQAQSYEVYYQQISQAIQQNDYPKAAALSEKAKPVALKRFGKTGDRYINLLSELGGLYLRMSQFSKAESNFKLAINSCETRSGANSPNCSYLTSQLGATYMEAGRLQEAEKLLRQSLIHIGKLMGKRNQIYASTLLNLANVYTSLERYFDAEKIYLEVEGLMKASVGTRHPQYALALNNLANVYIETGQYRQAEALYQVALPILQNAGGELRAYYPLCLMRYGEMQTLMGRHSQAVSTLQKAKGLIANLFGKDSEHYGTVLNSLGASYVHLEQPQQAETVLRESLRLQAQLEGENSAGYASALHNLAGAYQIMGKYQLAEQHYLKSQALKKKLFGADAPELADNHLNMGLLYWQMRQPEKSATYFQTSARALNRQVSAYYSGLTELEKLQFLLYNLKGNSDILFSFLYQQQPRSPDFRMAIFDLILNSRGLAMSAGVELRKAVAKSNDSMTKGIYKEWQDFTRKLNNAYMNSRGNQMREDRTVDSLLAGANYYEKLLMVKMENLGSLPKYPTRTWRQVQNKLKSGEAAVIFQEFNIYDLTTMASKEEVAYFAMVIKPGLTAPQIVPLCDGDELGYYLKFSDARDQDIYIQDRTAAYELYELLWKPLTPHLGGIKTVHFSPSGLGHQLAFSILVDESGKRLYRQYQLHHHTSLRDWLEGNKPIASKLKRSITVLGGANYNQRPAAALTRTPQVDRVLPAMRALNTWPALPGTGKERAAITGIFKSRQWQVQDLSGANASENRVKELSGRAPRIVHLATHGFFIPRPKDKAELKRINLKGSSFSRNVSLLDQPLLRSGLILAGGNLAWQQGGTQGSGKENGILTAFEIAGLDLTGTELVTLSACDTGLGDIFTWEGVFGLQRAFKIAGVDKLIISLWKVADDATLNFMESFYRHYLSGKTIHEAFRNTRLEMEEKYEPYFWAGFVLVE